MLENKESKYLSGEDEGDSIGVGGFIECTREEKNIDIKKLCEGICSKSFFSELTKNKKPANKLITDFLLQRLGILENEFESYLSSKEYRRYMMRNKIINFIEKKEIENAKKEIKLYKSDVDEKDKFHKRFILLMEARIMQLQSEDYEKIYITLRKAVDTTILSFENINLKELVLGYNEIFFMIECAYFKEKAYKDNSSQKFYEEIIEYISARRFEDIIKAKLYSKVVCLAAKKQLLDKQYDIVLKNCNKTMIYLQKSGKLYFIIEIMENKKGALEGIIYTYEQEKSTSEKEIKKLNTYKNMYEENEREKKFLCELFEEYNITSEPFAWYPYNHSTDLHSISEVIKKRREMLNISQIELSEGICDPNTFLQG